MAATERAFVAQPIPAAGGRVIASPFQFYTTGEDRLRVTVVNALTGVVVNLHWRFIDNAGTITANRETLTPTADRAATTRDLELGVGALLNLTVFVSGATPQIGQTFVIVRLIRGFGTAALVLGTMLQCYITSVQHGAWPGSPVQASIEGPGAIRSITGTGAAAGNELNETVPTGARWQLLNWRAALNTNGVVANRWSRLKLASPTDDIVVHLPSDSIGGSSSVFVNYAIGVRPPTGILGQDMTEAIASDIPLTAGSTLRSFTLNLQAGDQYTNHSYQVREWLEVS